MIALFGKQAQSAVQQVLDLRRKGATDNQIIQELQKFGISTQKIFDAMSQADLSGTPSLEPQDFPSDLPPPPENYPPQQYPDDYPAPGSSTPDDERIHEVAEAIINEKWDEVLKDIKKIVEWKESVENTIQQLKDKTDAIKDDFNQLHQGILGKVNESDANMRNVSSELQAIHKVFKDVIPSFTENVAELSRLTKKVKKK